MKISRTELLIALQAKAPLSIEEKSGAIHKISLSGDLYYCNGSGLEIPLGKLDSQELRFLEHLYDVALKQKLIF